MEKNIEFLCENCDKIVKRHISNYNKQKHHFCSNECSLQFRFKTGKCNPKVEIKCECCGESKFYPKYSHDINHPKFCSKKCFGIVRTKKNTKDIICDFCKKQSKKIKSQINSTNFCNKFCYAEYQRNKRKSVSNRGTSLRRLIKNSFKYKEWRKVIYKKANYKCEECGNKGFLNAHHIYSFSKILEEFLKQNTNLDSIKDKELLLQKSFNYDIFWDTSNGMCLCEICHQKIHPNLTLTLSKMPCKHK